MERKAFQEQATRTMRAQLRLLLPFCMALLSNSGSVCAHKWDLEYWLNVNWENWEKGPYRLFTNSEIRFNQDVSKFYYYRVTEGFAYQACPILDLEAHYSLIYNKSPGASQFLTTQRLEIEVNPSYRFDNGIAIKSRNRMQLIKKQKLFSRRHLQENNGAVQYVFRKRLLVSFPLKNCDNISSVQIYDEVFYDFDLNKFTQNRLVPIEMTFAINRRLDCNVFFMIRNFYSLGSDQWFKSFVIGSQLNF